MALRLSPCICLAPSGEREPGDAGPKHLARAADWQGIAKIYGVRQLVSLDPLGGPAAQGVGGQRGIGLGDDDGADRLAERIERYKLPDAIYLRDALPVGSTGKMSRAGVAKLAQAAQDEPDTGRKR